MRANCSIAFKFGRRRSSSPWRRRISMRYSSSVCSAAVPPVMARFSSGRAAKSIARSAVRAGVAAGLAWLPSATAAASCSASKPPAVRGTSTSSSTLLRKSSARVSCRVTSCARRPTRRRCVSDKRCCCSRRCNRHSKMACFALPSWSTHSSSSCFAFCTSPCRVSDFCDICSCSASSVAISAWQSATACVTSLELRSCRLCSTTTISWPTQSSCCNTSRSRACSASCSRRQSSSILLMSSTPMSALSCAK
mmetsp:Transcript_108722/g.307302  ORF Transcript_108722/g.307302 Transcript_108722/m.307302 type:complete len:251 (-) Transcript_108722:2395-3147(-)